MPVASCATKFLLEMSLCFFKAVVVVEKVAEALSYLYGGRCCLDIRASNRCFFHCLISCGMWSGGRIGESFPSHLFLTRVKIASDSSSKRFVFVGAIPSRGPLARHERFVALETAYRTSGGGTVSFRRQPLEKAFERA